MSHHSVQPFTPTPQYKVTLVLQVGNRLWLWDLSFCLVKPFLALAEPGMVVVIYMQAKWLARQKRPLQPDPESLANSVGWSSTFRHTAEKAWRNGLVAGRSHWSQ